MTTAVTSQVTRAQFIMIMLCLSVFMIFALMVIRDADAYRNGVQSEIETVRSSLTTAEWNTVDERAKRRFSKYVHESGFFQVVQDWFLPDENASAVNQTFSGKWNYRLVENLQVFLYQCIYRFTMLEFWLWTLLPLVIAIIVSGINAHRAKRYQLEGTRANIVRLYLKAIWLSALGLIGYMVLPAMLGAMAPYAPAMAFLLLAFSASGVVSAFHKG
ncbi:hypothetical protein C9975_04765 [Thalassospira xiamenensis]|nr:hypothetical protein C9975_04765 [Thalassospira xiamenensis]